MTFWDLIIGKTEYKKSGGIKEGMGNAIDIIADLTPIYGFLKGYFLVDTPWRRKFGTILNRMDRGNGMLALVYKVAIVVGIGSLAIGTRFDWIPQWVLYVSGIVALIGLYTLGYIDEKWGIWSDQNRHATERNPVIMGMDKNIKEIKEMLLANKTKENNVDKIINQIPS